MLLQVATIPLGKIFLEMPPRGLSDLPEEILLYIVEAACEGEHFSKIHNLIFVNHRISRLAVPFLYRNLRDGDFVDGESDAFRKLTFTLLFDPIKAAYVHSFTLDNGDEYGQGPPLIDETSDGELKELGDAVEQLAELQVEVLKDYAGSEEAKKIWERDFLGKPLMGAFLALILGQLPNLHELTITDVNDDYWKVFEYVTDAMTAASKDVDTGVKTPFVNLEKVTMGDMNCNSKSIAETSMTRIPLRLDPRMALFNLSPHRCRQVAISQSRRRHSTW